MTPFRRFRFLAGVVATVTLLACDDDDPVASESSVVLDQTVPLDAGVTCETGGVSKAFNGHSGKTVTITATGTSDLRPQFTLYASDFTTQIAGSSAAGNGKASLTRALTETGVYHLTICEANGKAGSLRVVATER